MQSPLQVYHICRKLSRSKPSGNPAAADNLHLSFINLSHSHDMIRTKGKHSKEKGAAMRIYAVAMLLTGVGMLSACGAANSAGSGASVPSAKTDNISAETDTILTEKAAKKKEETAETVYSLPNLNSFTARTLDGGSFTADDFSGADVTVINIWSTTCGPCTHGTHHPARKES